MIVRGAAVVEHETATPDRRAVERRSAPAAPVVTVHAVRPRRARSARDRAAHAMVTTEPLSGDVVTVAVSSTSVTRT
jgi:hypothetical protein